MDKLATDVIQMVANERGLSPAKISLSSRLFEDLGMDGDDAIDFFASLEKEFGTDFSALYERWSEHFSPEGFSCWNGLIIVPAGVIGGIAAGMLHLGTVGGIGITVALLALWLWVVKNFGPPNTMKPITVAEVIDAVAALTWPRCV